MGTCIDSEYEEVVFVANTGTVVFGYDGKHRWVGIGEGRAPEGPWDILFLTEAQWHGACEFFQGLPAVDGEPGVDKDNESL